MDSLQRFNLLAITIVFVLAAAAVQLGHAKSISKDSSLPPAVQEKLSALRKLSIEAGLPQTHLDEDVCYTDGCIDAAFEILSSINATIDPCKEFEQFACGRWIADNPIPSDQLGWYKTSQQSANVQKVILAFLSEPQNETDPLPLNQARQLFSMCMDTDAIENAGLESLKRAVNELGGWQLLDPTRWDENSFDWLKAIAETTRRIKRYPVFTVPEEYANFTDTYKQVIMIDQAGFHQLPRNILVARSLFPTLFEAYENYIFRVAKELGSSQDDEDLKKVAQEIVAFEEKLALISRDSVERYNLSTLYNEYILQEYQDDTDGVHDTFKINWSKLFTDVGIENVRGEEKISVGEPEYVRKVIPLLAEEATKDSHVLANYIVWTFVAGSAGLTTKNMRDIVFEFQKELYGADELPARDAVCSSLATTKFPLPVSAKYVERVFNDTQRDEVIDMVGDMKEAFGEIVRELPWMKNETKEKAIEKSELMKELIGYPDWIRNKTVIEGLYEGLTLPGNFMSAMHAISEYTTSKNMKAVREPINREPWAFIPLTDVNGVHHVEFNAIVINVGLLQRPYFGKGFPKHQNYGGIGFVLGHEITHGFDQQGSQFDKEGNLVDWWDADTKREYQARSKCLEDQYSNFCYEFGENDKLCLKGELGIGENMADNGGVRQSYKAYKKYVDRNGPEMRLPGLESMTTDQLFFISYAYGWCGSSTPEFLRRTILVGPHSPGDARLKGPLRNSVEFANAYNCPIDSDGMNPPVEEKCTIW